MTVWQVQGNYKMIKKKLWAVTMLILVESVYAAESDLATEFANEIDAELGETKAAKSSKGNTTPPSNPDMEGWTVNGFLKSINRTGPDAATPVVVPVEDVIKEAARRGASHAKKSPYLNAVSDEANDLSVNAVDTRKVKGIVRNIPPISRIEYSENMIEIGGRVIRDGYITVKEGDSLSLIAVQVYGDANQYDRIYQANKNVLTDPDVVSAGTRLFIPVN